MARVVVDAGFLIGLYDQRDQHHEVAVGHFEAIFGSPSSRNVLVVPWPILYECLGTRQARSPRRRHLFGEHFNYLKRSKRLMLLDDAPYRDAALPEHLEDVRPLSLADRVVRAMIMDSGISFDVLLTYNPADFHDACRIRRVRLIDQNASARDYEL